MADKTFDATHMVRDAQARATAATAIGMNALKPMMHFQASMLRMWADSIERLAGGMEEAANTVEEQSDKNGLRKLTRMS